MEKLKLTDKLKDRADISYEEAKRALENSNWDMLDAMLYLESNGSVKKPEVSIFYTNEYKESYNKGEVIKLKEDKYENSYKSKNRFEGFFEEICKVIDTCNNIFIKIVKNNRTLLKIPFTVVILLLIFTFWIVIPLMIIGLFFDLEFSASSTKVNTDKVNKVFRKLLKVARKIKGEFTKHMR